MPLPTRMEIENLLRIDDQCVSIYLPTHRSGREVQQAKIRLKNLLREAERRLGADILPKAEVDEMLGPVHRMLEDEEPWRHLQDGLAIFLAPGVFRSYLLPRGTEEALVTGTRFHLLPLMPLFAGERSFFILALSQKTVRFLEANRYRAIEVDLGDLPQSLTDVVGEDWKPTSLQHHSSGATGTGATFHGQGGMPEEGKAEILRFCQRLDHGLRERVGRVDQPLVVAAVDYLIAIYRQASHYPNLLEEGVEGNPDGLSNEALREKAWQIVGPRFRESELAAVARCRELLGTGKASSDLRELLPAAFDGRIEVLMTAKGAERWGTFDSTNRRLQIHDDPQPGDEELLNLGVTQCLRYGGGVLVVPEEELPGGSQAAAIYRY